jgi:hypothetical protein
MHSAPRRRPTETTAYTNEQHSRGGSGTAPGLLLSDNRSYVAADVQARARARKAARDSRCRRAADHQPRTPQAFVDPWAFATCSGAVADGRSATKNVRSSMGLCDANVLSAHWGTLIVSGEIRVKRERRSPHRRPDSALLHPPGDGGVRLRAAVASAVRPLPHSARGAGPCSCPWLSRSASVSSVWRVRYDGVVAGCPRALAWPAIRWAS